MKASICIIFLSVALSYNVRGQETAPDSVKIYLKNARGFLTEGNKAEANAIYSWLMKNHPQNREVVKEWLKANMKRAPDGELLAIHQLDSLNRIYPGNCGIIFFRAFIKTEYGQNEEALRDIEKLISMQPDSADIRILYGQLMYEMKKHREASEAFKKAIILYPGNADVYGMCAAALLQAGNPGEAISVADRGVALFPGNPGAFYNRGCIFALNGDKVHALDDLRKAVEINPGLKQHARKDEDFKTLWEDEEFKTITK
jgi:tetratricopeptide (TPR) repeat protein